MKKGCIRLWLVGLLGLVLGVGAEASSGVQVLGQVRLDSGLPVDGARVVLFDLGDLRRGVVAQATTDADGLFALPLAASGRGAALPEGFVLGANYPNPFNPATIIPYQLAAGAQVRLEVFNALGQRMAVLVDGEQAAGAYQAQWDATDAAGRAAAAGVYLYRLTVASTSSAHSTGLRQAQSSRSGEGGMATGRMVLVDGQAGFDRTSASSVGPLSPRGDGSLLRAELVEARPVEASDSAYGLVVSGPGLVTYVDADFRVEAGMESVVIEVAAQPDGRMKVVQSGILGDVDNNGQVDMNDGFLVMMYFADPAVSMPNSGDIVLGDVNCDRRTNWLDAWLIVTYVIDPSDPAVQSLRIGQSGGCAWEGGSTRATKMYWTEWVGGKIRRADLDGSNVEDLVAGLKQPVGIALDVAGSKMYWTDMNTDKIRRADLDGSNVEDLVTGLGAPAGIALDVAGGKIYWTEWGTKKIRCADLNGSNVEDLVTGLGAPAGIALDVAGGKIYWTDMNTDKIQRADLNGTNVEDLVTGLDFPHGIALDVAGGKIYWTEWGTEKIKRTDLNGTNVEDLVTGLHSPYRVALDVAGGKMYWTDINAQKIQRADLNGSNVEDLVTGLDNPAGIALDVFSP